MKLLNRTIRSYLFYSFLALLITIPLFYFVVRGVLLRSVDRSLRVQMQDIRSNLGSINSASDLAIWAKMDKDIQINEANGYVKDAYYTIYRKNPRHHDDDPYRELSGSIQVNGKWYQLIISSSLVENEDLLGSILLVQSVLLILLMAGLLWINRSIAKNIWQPFYSTLDRMKKYELNKHNSFGQIPTAVDEFKELQSAIKNLTDRNFIVYQKQKEFTENASHEMQTPLAIFHSKLELLMQTQPLSEEQATLISTMEEVNLRLSKLNKSLLLLSKIDNKQFPQIENISLKEITKSIADQFRPNAELKRIAIEEDFLGSQSIMANKTLLEILISNLLSNAIRYNIEGGELRIKLCENILTIENSGNGERFQGNKIFERFYKSGDYSGSVGLGLAIAKEICDLYKFGLTYENKGKFHQFNVRFGEDSAQL
jgi:signal transduction histidine kinase